MLFGHPLVASRGGQGPGELFAPSPAPALTPSFLARAGCKCATYRNALLLSAFCTPARLCSFRLQLQCARTRLHAPSLYLICGVGGTWEVLGNDQGRAFQPAGSERLRIQDAVTVRAHTGKLPSPDRHRCPDRH